MPNPFHGPEPTPFQARLFALCCAGWVAVVVVAEVWAIVRSGL